jgi:integration host factor subunit beta
MTNVFGKTHALVFNRKMLYSMHKIRKTINEDIMTKSELMQELGQQFSDLSAREVEKAVDVIFNEISAALAKGNRVELRGFGAFSVRYRERRIGRNPRTGAKVDVSSKYVPFFKSGKGLRDRLNG